MSSSRKGRGKSRAVIPACCFLPSTLLLVCGRSLVRLVFWLIFILLETAENGENVSQWKQKQLLSWSFSAATA